MISSRTSLGVVALLLSACASDGVQQLAEEPNYGRGYSDGCQTAAERSKSFSTKVFRDDVLFNSDKGYRAGWRYGYQNCGIKTSRAPDGGRVLGEEGDR